MSLLRSALAAALSLLPLGAQAGPADALNALWPPSGEGESRWTTRVSGCRLVTETEVLRPYPWIGRSLFIRSMTLSDFDLGRVHIGRSVGGRAMMNLQRRPMTEARAADIRRFSQIITPYAPKGEDWPDPGDAEAIIEAFSSPRANFGIHVDAVPHANADGAQTHLPRPEAPLFHDGLEALANAPEPVSFSLQAHWTHETRWTRDTFRAGAVVIGGSAPLTFADKKKAEQALEIFRVQARRHCPEALK